MSAIPLTIYTKRFFRCPNGCDKEWAIEHLFEGGHKDAGPWFCYVCHEGWRIHLDGEKVAIEKSGRKSFRTVTRLRLIPQDDPIEIEVDGSCDGTESDAELSAQKRYYYEESTCSANIFRSALDVWLGETKDPHGLFEYLSTEVDR